MISLIILGIIFLYAIISYNTLTRKRNNVDNAFGSIDVMLKKRFDLIPNLVATVQQYAKHEEETFTKITNLRTKSYDSLTAEEKADFDKTFTAAKNNFFMVAENYPALRSSDYNNSVMTFPSNIIANLFSFTKKEVFAIPEEEKVNPDVKKLFRS